MMRCSHCNRDFDPASPGTYTYITVEARDQGTGDDMSIKTNAIVLCQECSQELIDHKCGILTTITERMH